MLRIVILAIDPWNCRFRYAQTSSQRGSLPKANIGACLDEFAGDVRAILDAKLKNF